MNKKTSSYKTKLILCGIALLLATVGTTYAWWTASSQVEQSVTMGNLNVEATFTEPEEELINFEPGLYTEIEGTIKNTGSIVAMVKVTNDSLITMKYDENMGKIPNSEQVEIPADDNVIQISYEPENGNYSDGDGYYWFVDKNGEYYIMMNPQATVKTIITINFNGETMTNQYMDAVVKAKANIRATQVLDGALRSEFGVDSDMLDPVMTNGRNAGRGLEILRELISRGAK